MIEGRMITRRIVKWRVGFSCNKLEESRNELGLEMSQKVVAICMHALHMCVWGRCPHVHACAQNLHVRTAQRKRLIFWSFAPK